jgi:hypothetical protein
MQIRLGPKMGSLEQPEKNHEEQSTEVNLHST